MVTKEHKQTGFTIVELLIVIVVIGILAAITIVAYNGVQSRSNDAAIQSDIRNFVTKIRLYEVDNGKLPTAGQRTGDSTKFPGMAFRPSKAAYDTTVLNFLYCEGLKSGLASFTITARSKSKTIFIYRPDEGVTTIVSTDTYGQCMSGYDSGTAAYSYGFYPVSQTWYTWTN